MEKIRIGGIKLSGECLLLNLKTPLAPADPGQGLVGCLADNRINILFYAGAQANGLYRSSFCVAAGDGRRVRALLGPESPLNRGLEIVPSVGLLCLFPHRYSLKILGLSLCAFGRASIPLLSMNSSLSSLTFVTDYARLDRAAEILGQYFDFPALKPSAPGKK